MVRQGKRRDKFKSELRGRPTISQNFEGSAVLRDRIQAIETLFNQKAMPTMLEKYYTEIEEIVNNDTKLMEIIDKILAKNNVLN